MVWHGVLNQRATRARAGWAALLLILVSGCGPPRPRYPAALNAERPEHRIWALRHAAEIKDHDAIPILVDRLGDEDEAVRLYAILALERLTGTRLGYNYHASENERARAIARWRQRMTGNAAKTQPVE